MSQLSIQQAFDLALQHHQAARLHAAEQLYRQILAQQPEHVDAMHYLGLLTHQLGRKEMALDLLRRATALRPGDAQVRYHLGVVLQSNGQLDEAIAAFQRALALAPNSAETCNDLGNALKDTARLDQAIVAFEKAIALRPNFAAAHYNLGNVLKEKGQLDEAIAAFRTAVALDPALAQARNNLGVALQQKGEFTQAIAAYQQAIALAPAFADAHNNLGTALKAQGRLDEAIAAFKRVLVLRPDHAGACNNLGSALRERGLLDEAVAAYQKAISLKRDYADAYSNLGNVLKEQARLDESIAACRQAIKLCPTLPEAHNNLAMSLLARGDLPQGWEEYEWRSKCKDFPSPRRNFPQSRWDAEPLNGRTLLLYAEQGAGDMIQFIRYLPLVAQCGGRIIVECPPELLRLFQTSGQPCQFVPRGEPLPAFDLQCPLLSLPLVFKTTLESIPARVPYLFPDPKLLEFWREKTALSASGLKVALTWAGNPACKGDRTRSLSLDALAPFSQARGVTFYSVQKGDAAGQARQPPAGLQLIDLSPELHDFADTAAALCSMDLVITTCTSVAHLAGALGRPVWVMLQFAPDWRWLLDRQDSPWYPSARLFRQSARGDWNGVIRRILQALSAFHPDQTPPAES